MLLSPQRDVEAPVLQVAERVCFVVQPEVRHQVPATLAPPQGLRRRHAVHDLHDAAFVDAILGPRSWEVLDTADLDGRNSARHPPDPMTMRVSRGVRKDSLTPCGNLGQAVTAVGIQTEVLAVSLSRDPLLMVTHHEHRTIRRGRQLVEPLQLLGADRARRVFGSNRVEQGNGDTGKIDPLVARIFVLPVIRVVIAANDMEAIAEGIPIEGFERGKLVISAVACEVTLHHNSGKIRMQHLGDGRVVHRLGMGRLTERDLLNRAAWIVVDLATLNLAEVQVVDRADPTQQLTVGTRQRSHLMSSDVMDGGRVEFGETDDEAGGPGLMGHDQIVGDGRDVHADEGSGARRAPSGGVAARVG